MLRFNEGGVGVVVIKAKGVLLFVVVVFFIYIHCIGCHELLCFDVVNAVKQLSAPPTTISQQQQEEY